MVRLITEKQRSVNVAKTAREEEEESRRENEQRKRDEEKDDLRIAKALRRLKDVDVSSVHSYNTRLQREKRVQAVSAEINGIFEHLANSCDDSDEGDLDDIREREDSMRSGSVLSSESMISSMESEDARYEETMEESDKRVEQSGEDDREETRNELSWLNDGLYEAQSITSSTSDDRLTWEKDAARDDNPVSPSAGTRSSREDLPLDDILPRRIAPPRRTPSPTHVMETLMSDSTSAEEKQVMGRNREKRKRKKMSKHQRVILREKKRRENTDDSVRREYSDASARSVVIVSSDTEEEMHISSHQPRRLPPQLRPDQSMSRSPVSRTPESLRQVSPRNTTVHEIKKILNSMSLENSETQREQFSSLLSKFYGEMGLAPQDSTVLSDGSVESLFVHTSPIVTDDIALMRKFPPRGFVDLIPVFIRGADLTANIKFKTCQDAIRAVCTGVHVNGRSLSTRFPKLAPEVNVCEIGDRFRLSILDNTLCDYWSSLYTALGARSVVWDEDKRSAIVSFPNKNMARRVGLLSHNAVVGGCSVTVSPLFLSN